MATMATAPACACLFFKEWRKTRMDERKSNIKVSEQQEDKAIAHNLAAALHEDDVEKFLQLYDEIPAGISRERLDNIKEMARQVAALTRSSNYRHSPMPVIESTYFGINHTLQMTPLTLGSQLNMTDFSAFKTPPEGLTPVDHKHFDYEEKTLKASQVVHSLSLSSFYDKQLNESGITHQECLDAVNDEDIERSSETHKDEIIKTNDDDAFDFHTPPTEFEDNEGPPFGYPVKTDKLINSVIDLLSRTTVNNPCQDEGTESFEKENNTNEAVKEQTDEVFQVVESEENDDVTIKIWSEENCFKQAVKTVELEQDSSEKDSLDGSPQSRKSFAQEEDDSGISLVDENDVHESALTNSESFEEKNNEALPVVEKSREKCSYHSSNVEKFNKKEMYNAESGAKLNTNELEDSSSGWQTRHRRISKKRQDREFGRMSYNGVESKSNYKEEATPRRSSRTKDRNRFEKMESCSKVTERQVVERSKDKLNSWTGRMNEEYEKPLISKRRRSGQSGKKSEGRRSKEKNGDSAQSWNQEAKMQLEPNAFSYRDALLKAGSKVSNSKPKELMRTQLTVRNSDRMFNVESAVNYLSSVWTNVNNLRRKDPSKVYIYNGD